MHRNTRPNFHMMLSLEELNLRNREEQCEIDKHLRFLGKLGTPNCLSSDIRLKQLRKRKWLERAATNKFWDVRLLFDDGFNVLCNQSDLCTMSLYFERMFQSNFIEAGKRDIILKGVNSKLMEDMVGLYCDCEVSSSGIANRFAYACSLLIRGELCP
jgi:hypothetical protein